MIKNHYKSTDTYMEWVIYVMINMTLNKNIKNNQKGITLIELLVVISIIGILAAVTMPNLFAAVDRAKEARDIANQMGKEVYSPSYQRYSIEGVNIPNSSVTYITVNDKGIYHGADHVRQDHGEEIAALFGYDIPAKSQNDNVNIYWDATSAGSATLESGRYVFIGHLRVLIFEF